METISVPLPKQMTAFLKSQISEGGHKDAGDYVRKLIRAEQKRKAQERLEALLLEGLKSGRAEPMTDDWVKRMRKRISARHENGQKR